MRKTIVIATVDSKMGLLKNNGIPWDIRENKVFFDKKIKDNIVVMSRRHWIINKRIPDCINFVLNLNVDNMGDFSGGLAQLKKVMDNNPEKDVYIIGGKEIFKIYADVADEIILTKINKNYDCDTFFPLVSENYEISKSHPDMFSIEENCFYSRLYYIGNGGKLHEEYKYLDLLQEAIDSMDNNILFLKAKSISFECVGRNKIPMMTTNKVDYEKVTSKLFSAFNGNGEMGFNWRFFGAKYSKLFENEIYFNKKEILGGIDQLDIIDRQIKKSENNIMTLTSINPIHGIKEQGSLCQFAHIDNKLSLVVHIPTIELLKINECIVFYSILLYFIAIRSHKRPGNISFVFGFIVFKKDQQNIIQEILNKSPSPFPIVSVYDYVRYKKLHDVNIMDLVVSGY